MSTKENPLNITETSFFPFFLSNSFLLLFVVFFFLLFVLFLLLFLRNMSKKGTDSKGLPTPAPGQPWGWVLSQFVHTCCRNAPHAPLRGCGSPCGTSQSPPVPAAGRILLPTAPAPQGTALAQSWSCFPLHIHLLCGFVGSPFVPNTRY